MKKIVALIIVGSMILTMAGCKVSKLDKNSSSSETQLESSEEATLSGGWTRADSPAITDEVRALVEKASSNLVGAEYEPIVYIGSQIVAGTNHRLLCKITPVVPDPVSKLAIVTIYEDLDGNAEITDIAEMVSAEDYDESETGEVSQEDYAESETGEVSREDYAESESEAGAPDSVAEASESAGGWEEPETPDLTDDAKEAIEKATADLTGALYSPVALLASQVVSGTNYELLCEITPTFDGADSTYAIMVVYEDLEGNAQITDVEEFVESEDETAAESEDETSDETAAE